ncbi:unnamed protein product [Paramecium sonneborni]|uniref:Uncharacterized protein n=1 Tax=Paramecium sonneborni TaxID=65129 RepID=A0A8S1KK56_9CILI|nr:unnamed protein product [Paramecium sonneborni]
MQQNSFFDEKDEMEIENLLASMKQSKDYAVKQSMNLFYKPFKQNDLKLENEMNDSSFSSNIKKGFQNYSNLSIKFIQGKYLKKITKKRKIRNNFKQIIKIFSKIKRSSHQIKFKLKRKFIIILRYLLVKMIQVNAMEHLVKLSNKYMKLKKFLEVFIFKQHKQAKDDELFQLNIELEKEFNICRNQNFMDFVANSQMNQTLGIHKKYQQIQEIKKNKFKTFNKKYEENFNQIRRDFDDLKKSIQEMFSKITFNSYIQDIEKSHLIYFQDDKLEGEFQPKSLQLREDQNIEIFIEDLTQIFNISKEDYQNIEDLKQQILKCVEQQKNHLEIIQTNQNLSMNQQIIKLNIIKDELKNELIQLNQFKELQEKILDQNKIEIQKLQQKLEQIEKRDYLYLNTKLFQHVQIQMEQQQNLIQISLIIIQQLFQSNSFESSLKITLSEKYKYLNNYFEEAKKLINERSWKIENNPLKYLQLHQQKIEETINIIYLEYCKMISWIKQQREILMDQL